MSQIPVKEIGNEHYGFANASPRKDPFFQQARALVKSGSTVTVVGAAFGLEAYEFAKRGAKVTAIDIANYSDEIARLNWWLKLRGKPPIKFLQDDATRLNAEKFLQTYPKADIFYANRVSHFFDIPRSVSFCQFAEAATKPDAQIFIFALSARYLIEKKLFEGINNSRRVIHKAGTTVPVYHYDEEEKKVLLAYANLVGDFVDQNGCHEIIARKAKTDDEVEMVESLKSLYPFSSIGKLPADPIRSTTRQKPSDCLP